MLPHLKNLLPWIKLSVKLQCFLQQSQQIIQKNMKVCVEYFLCVKKKKSKFFWFWSASALSSLSLVDLWCWKAAWMWSMNEHISPQEEQINGVGKRKYSDFFHFLLMFWWRISKTCSCISKLRVTSLLKRKTLVRPLFAELTHNSFFSYFQSCYGLRLLALILPAK